ncbi:hypothetical protein LX32DRAFT_636531 [Colletotrichum zoysiae]|uniref:Uncharacterized protein n=1 Tax=Colletotrichum zoysiae TaxID=1216348 RepID=A0AAD9HN27_9PEZI|nr:hypothetical protein LX32DRAFT_636531 [Colletotrichum zoysiae]
MLLPSKLLIVSLTSHGVVAFSYLITIPGAPDSMRDCTKCQPHACDEPVTTH